jgi:eukaryotic-like serine/threonine-protein kinase
VANAETFCPYCGIKLERPEPADDEVDDSLESTLMMSPSEALRLSDEAIAERGSEKAVAEDNVESGESDDDVPVPAVLNEFTRTEGNLPTTSTSEYSVDDIGAGSDPSPARPAEGSRPGYPAEELGSFGNDPLTAASPFAAGAHVSDASPPVEQSGNVHNVVEPDVDLEDVPPPSFLQEQAPGGSVSRPGERAAPASAERESGADKADDPKSPPVIAKPGDDLSAFDSYKSQAMFDSVRIMEPSNLGGKPDDTDTRLHPESKRLDQLRHREMDSVSEPKPPETPATSHSIGMVDTDGKKGSKLKPLAEGTILNGRYEIIRKIGGGGMGAVYLASDNNLGGVLRAVKEMVQTHIEEEQQEKAINDFKRESMILSSLDHVSIPTIYDYFYDDKESRFYLVMKYISGGDLSSRLRSAKEGRIDEKTVCEWAVQIIDVLDYLHNQPSTIVYRDLKPSNIMIDGNSARAMLIDFGIARSISQKEEKGVTAVGTMGYAPPELFSGNVEPRSDIYSLGSTMFHLLTGADPQSNPLLIFDFQKNPRPRQINPQLSDQVERIIMKAVQYNADERFRSAAEMRDVLEDHLLKLKAGIVTFGVGEVPASVSLANQSVFCGFCGQRIVATDMFCAFCGAKQPIAQQGVHSEIYTQAGFTAKLVVEGTSELSAPAFSLQKDENLLGRRDPMSNIFPEVDLSKYDPQTKISRRHARIWREGNNFLVEDLGSSNGTVLSRSPSETFRLTPKQPQVLSAGDRLRLGDATLHFIIG